MSEAKCSHRQCEICLERECHKGLGERFKSYGPFTVCHACILKSIAWAYTTACRWGGEYGHSKECGEKPKEKAHV